MADNIIDVNMAHTSQTLEPAELQERAFEYGRQLQLVSSKLAQKYSYLKSGKSDGLQDVSANQVDKLVQSEVLNTSDKILISEVAARAREANADFKITPVPNLTGVFGQFENSMNSVILMRMEVSLTTMMSWRQIKTMMMHLLMTRTKKAHDFLAI